MKFYEDDIVTGKYLNERFIGIVMNKEDYEEDEYPVRFYLPEREAQEESRCPGSVSYEVDDLWRGRFYESDLTLDTSIFFDKPLEVGDELFVQEQPRFFTLNYDNYFKEKIFNKKHKISIVVPVKDGDIRYRRPYYMLEEFDVFISEYDLDKEKTLYLNRQFYTGVLTQMSLPNL